MKDHRVPSPETLSLILIVSKSVILQTDTYIILSKLHRPMSQQYVSIMKAIFGISYPYKRNFCRRHNITNTKPCLTYVQAYTYICIQT